MRNSQRLHSRMSSIVDPGLEQNQKSVDNFYIAHNLLVRTKTGRETNTSAKKMEQNLFSQSYSRLLPNHTQNQSLLNFASPNASSDSQIFSKINFYNVDINERIKDRILENQRDLKDIALDRLLRDVLDALVSYQNNVRLKQKENTILRETKFYSESIMKNKDNMLQELIQQNQQLKVKIGELQRLQKTAKEKNAQSQLQLRRINSNLPEKIPANNNQIKKMASFTSRIRESKINSDSINESDFQRQERSEGKKPTVVLEKVQILKNHPSSPVIQLQSPSLMPQEANSDADSPFLQLNQERSNRRRATRLGTSNRRQSKIIEMDKQSPDLRGDFIQHSMDFNFFSQILDERVSRKQIKTQFSSFGYKNCNYFFILDDDEIQQEFMNNHCMENLERYTQNQTAFIKAVKSNDSILLNNLFQAIRYSITSNELALQFILQLKKVIQAACRMQSATQLSNAFETVVQQVCTILECNRASVFLVDFKNHQLWSKAAKGVNTIRIPLDVGFVGHTAKTGEILNILDAHQDERFNKMFDQKNNYRTRTVLVSPIWDEKRDQIIGVLQAINKNNDGYFGKDDEGIIQVIASLSRTTLKNSYFQDEKTQGYNSMRNLFNTCISLNICRDFQTLLKKAEQKLEINFSVPKAQIFVFDDRVKQLFFFDDFNECIHFDQQSGIAGSVFQSGELVLIDNVNENTIYNSLCDIETSLPIICRPIIHPSSNERLGVLQVVNPQGLESLFSEHNSQIVVPYTFYDTIEKYSMMLSQMILNLKTGIKEKSNTVILW